MTQIYATQTGVLTHLSDVEAWKHFNRTYTLFAAESRNVRLGLCADGFNPYSTAPRRYSVWPIVVCMYNLLPHLCMMRPCMFLSSVIPGPNNPKNKINVYLQPLINELKMLWNDGVDTYDVYSNQTFKMKAALM